MARIYEFMMGSSGDPSVGVMGFQERVTITFHDAPDSTKQEDRQEDEEFLRAHLEEMTDGGWCVPLRDHQQAREKDLIADALNHDEWKRSQLAETTGTPVQKGDLELATVTQQRDKLLGANESLGRDALKTIGKYEAAIKGLLYQGHAAKCRWDAPAPCDPECEAARKLVFPE